MNRFCCGFVASLIFLPIVAFGLPGESIVLDPNTGNYMITYLGINESTGERDVLRSATFEPATKIVPTIRTSLKIAPNGVVAYRYRINNAATSQRPIVMALFDPVSGLITTDSQIQLTLDVQSNSTAHNWGVASYPLNTPNGWTSRVTASKLNGLRIGWTSLKASIPPGESIGGFDLFSFDLPGVGVVQLRGKSAIREFADEGPTGEIGAQLRDLVLNDFVRRAAAVPTITIPVPFDAALLLDRIRTEMQTWPGKQLLDPAYAAQFDRHLVSAADAYRLNNTKAGREHIMTVRKMLAKEHRNLDHDEEDDDDTEERKTATRLSIDRLAARVLDFDLRYVLKRTEREHEEDKGKKGRD